MKIVNHFPSHFLIIKVIYLVVRNNIPRKIQIFTVLQVRMPIAGNVIGILNRKI